MQVNERTVGVKITSILGVTAPFVQGGSLRLTIPKRMVKKYNLKQKVSQEYFGYIFVETNKGVLLVSLDKVANPPNVKNALGFVDLSNLSKKDLKVIFEESENEEK